MMWVKYFVSGPLGLSECYRGPGFLCGSLAGMARRGLISTAM
jgi:hypothetical protein